MMTRRTYKHQREYLRRLRSLYMCKSERERSINIVWMALVGYQYRVVERKLLSNTLSWGRQFFLKEYPDPFQE